MDSRCLSAAGLRFLQPPAPAEELALPCGRVADWASDLNGVILFHVREMRAA